jgi:hypothetical protein
MSLSWSISSRISFTTRKKGALPIHSSVEFCCFLISDFHLGFGLCFLTILVTVVTAGGPLYNSGCRIFPLLAILANIAILSAPSCRCLCLGEARRCLCLGEALSSTRVCCGRRLCVLSVRFCGHRLVWLRYRRVVKHVATLVALSCVVAVNVIVSRQQRVCVVVALSCVVAVNVMSMMFRRSECSFCSSVREFSLF